MAGDLVAKCTARWNDDPNNCTFEATVPVTIVKPAALHIDPMPTACKGVPVSFQAVMDDPGHGSFIYEWFYGDGASDVVAAPTQPTLHTYGD